MNAIDKIIDGLNLSGMALLLANHATVIEHTDSLLVLRLGHVHRHLVDHAYTEKIHKALQSYYGDHFQLIVEVEPQPGPTLH